MTPGYMVDTQWLQSPIQKVQQALIGMPPPVYHVEAGITIRDLNQNLDSIGLALETMGQRQRSASRRAISTGIGFAMAIPLPKLFDSIFNGLLLFGLPGGKEKPLAEVSLIERDFAHSLAGQSFTSGCLLLLNTNH
jgi:hypothetical protein